MKKNLLKNKFSNFLVNNNIIISIIMILITIICGFLLTKVTITKDMTKYLSKNSEMKQGIDIMNSDFPQDKNTSIIRVVFSDLTEEQKNEIYKKLYEIKYVQNITYDKNSYNFNKDNHTLFILATSFPYDSKEELSIEQSLKNDFNEYNIEFQNNDIIKTEVPLWLLITAFCIILIILIIMSKSWLEPVLFMIVTGIAVIINLGTNIIFGTISDITISIAPILQLILSIDYSIIMTNLYRNELVKTENKKEAIKLTIANSSSSIFSSALTTIAGLLILSLLSFKIGPEIGLVLAKGVFISMICVFTLLPTLLIVFSDSIKKTEKRTFPIKTDWIGKLGFKTRRIIPVIFIVIFISTAIFQTFTDITFTEGNNDKFSCIFPKDNTTILLYNNHDENNIDSIIQNIEKDDNVISVIGYTNTFEKEYTAEELTTVFSKTDIGMTLDTSIIKMIYYKYNNENINSLTISELIKTIEDIKNTQMLSGLISNDTYNNLTLLENYSDKSLLEQEMTAPVLSSFLQIDTIYVNQIFNIHGNMNATTTLSMSPYNFISFIVENIDSPYLSQQFEPSFKQKIKVLKQFMDGVIFDKLYSPYEMNTIFSPFLSQTDENNINLVYLFYSAQNYYKEDWTMSLLKIFDYVFNTMISDKNFSFIFSQDNLQLLNEMKNNFTKSQNELKSDVYGRLIITTNYLEESEKTTDFLKKLNILRKNYLSCNSYIIGQSAMVFELQSSFKKEYKLITIITALIIFIVIALTFRSLIIPLILVLIVQCGVFITVSAIGLLGNSIYYLALLIVQSIIMGATIDYAIVLSSFYKNYRALFDIHKSISYALISSSNTILTSGSILIIVTAILGIFTKNITSEVLITISIGSLTSVLLILFILPSILIFCDKFIIKNRRL